MILPAAVMLHLLLLLVRAVAQFNVSKVALHLAIVKNLLAAHMFLLDSPKFISFFLALLEHFLLSDLLSTFVEDSILLSLAQTLEMVRLHAVGG
jgi:hypothetical protein